MTVVGIDPGVSGGIVSLRCSPAPEPPTLERKHAMPSSDDGVIALLESYLQLRVPFFVEKIPHFIPGKNIMGSQMSKLTGNQRFIYGYLLGRESRVTQVSPQEWQRQIKAEWDLPKRSAGTTSEWKNHLRDVACRELDLGKKYLPLWAADAALIALHGMRSLGELKDIPSTDNSR